MKVSTNPKDVCVVLRKTCLMKNQVRPPFPNPNQQCFYIEIAES